LIGALALACFVKVFAAVFLGQARSEHAQHAHEAGPAMLGPMGILAGCCVLIGLVPLLVAPTLELAVYSWAPELPDLHLANLAPLVSLSGVGLLLLGFLGVSAALLGKCLQRSEVTTAVTWDCGYAAGSPRVQYTASSFAQMLVGMFGWALRQKQQVPHLGGVFPGPAHFHSEVPDTVLDRATLPAFRFIAWLFSWSRLAQQGSIQVYLLYIFVVLIVLLLWP
jgi:hydrogenase-4 component B